MIPKILPVIFFSDITSTYISIIYNERCKL
jgi:hypothetical protein